MDIKDKFELLDDELAGANKPSDFQAFLARINRQDLVSAVTDRTPWAYFSQEVYREKELGIKGGGGLGILAGDITQLAEELSMPLAIVTPFYSGKTRQALFDFWESDGYEALVPGERGLEKLGTIKLSSLTYNEIPIDIYAKRRGSVSVITLYEPNIGMLYEGESNSDHRLYQEVVTGFAGYRALRAIGMDPAVVHMNEAATVFSAVARLDDLCDQGIEFDTALDEVRNRTIYTNHTLLQAAEGVFGIGQFEKLVFTNIRSDRVIDWIRSRFAYDGKIRLSTLAIEITAKKNGVSLLHSALSCQNYKDHAGGAVHFDNVTNGIADRWIASEIEALYRRSGVLDEFGLPVDDYHDRLDSLDIHSIREAKRTARIRMDQILKHRQDQRGNPIYIPSDAIILDFKRRLASYKRFDMLFQDIDKLRNILQTHNAHLVFAGRPHAGDSAMVNELHGILCSVEGDPVLKDRVHYVQNYDEELALAMAIGGDCAINVPVVGQEACGTSWMKDIANCKLLISTTDGGVADVIPPVYLEVAGTSYVAEADALYRQMEEACQIIEDPERLRRQIVRQLQAYLPIVSGSRMMRDYLNLGF